MAERSEQPIRQQKPYSLESPSAGLKLLAKFGAKFPLDNADRNAFNKPASRYLQLSMSKSNHHLDPRGAWVDPIRPVPTRTEDTQSVLPTNAIHNSHSDVTEVSPDLQFTPAHILDKEPT